MAIISGSNRADLRKISSYLEETVTTANADYVKKQTGFSIGGVSPVGSKNDMPVFIDEDLLTFKEIWAAAGTPNAVFKLHPNRLTELTEGKVIDLKV